ncbi:MAG TPA: NAD-dependent epimerase/dehydratase family protein [Chloroflexia bacterium]|nr:NAD-dependent epimerase/dehydratase family protein [Chloroflexia bacterium]
MAARCLVTGAAGFIGSHLAEGLLAEGHEVVGLDAFIPYYPREVKEANIAGLRGTPGFTFHELDLRSDDLSAALEGVETVFHLAAMGGLLLSWTNFDLYMTCNIQGTQRLLEAVRKAGTVRRFIHASTSSVYGADVTGPETTTPRPVSPYGITKLAAEHLVLTYDRQFDVPSTLLRYFSVYGPRQRPDMGYYIFIDSILHGKPITVFGDGNQLRGNTYVTDIARATMLAAERFERGSIYNLGGSEEISANQVIALLEEITGKKADVRHGPERPGEQRRALADTTLARERLGFTPQMPLREGLARQVEWQRLGR